MEQLDQGLTAIVVQSALFCMGIFLSTYGVRKVVETGWEGAKKSKWWNEVWLPLGPIATGVLLAFLAKTYTWPDIVKDPWSRAFYGGVCGLSSGWVYNRFRSILRAWSTGPVPGQKTAETSKPADPTLDATLPDAGPGPVEVPVGLPDEEKTPLP